MKRPPVKKLSKIGRNLAIALMTKDMHSKPKCVFKKEVVVAMVGFGFLGRYFEQHIWKTKENSGPYLRS